MHLNESNLRDPSTTSPVFHSTLVAAENHNVSQATTNPADRQFTDRRVVAAQANWKNS